MLAELRASALSSAGDMHACSACAVPLSLLRSYGGAGRGEIPFAGYSVVPSLNVVIGTRFSSSLTRLSGMSRLRASGALARRARMELVAPQRRAKAEPQAATIVNLVIWSFNKWDNQMTR